MKIDRRNPKHWALLTVFSAVTLIALMLRPFVRKNARSVILYGHKLNGNLLALYEESLKKDYDLDFHFLTMDSAYHQALREQGICSVFACSAGAAWLLARAKKIVTSHGLHAMAPLPLLTRIEFYDVWHGIPFKGFDGDDFRTQHKYKETWVTSVLLRKIYIEKFGFSDEQVIVTGYPRTDRLVNPSGTLEGLKRRLDLPIERQLILFAPTWTQDDNGRNIFPFNTNESDFITAISSIADQSDCDIILRPHLNTPFTTNSKHKNVHILSSRTHPDTEEILLVSDILICDWSSIAFDFLLLKRPVYFLDVPPPFRKGLTLGHDYRFGEVVISLQNLEDKLVSHLNDPEQYWQNNEEKHQRAQEKVYDDKADGKASFRCLERIRLNS